MTTLVSHLYDETNAGEDEREALNDLIEKRDLDGIKKVGTKSSSLIAAMLEHYGYTLDNCWDDLKPVVQQVLQWGSGEEKFKFLKNYADNYKLD